MRLFLKLKQGQKQHSNRLGIHFKIACRPLNLLKIVIISNLCFRRSLWLQNGEWIEGVKAGARKESCLKRPVGLKDGA